MSTPQQPSSDLALDLPEVRAEVAVVFARYEDALMANDVDTLDEMFWHDERTVRYGLSDRQHGFAEIAAYRRSIPAQKRPLTLRDTQITTFGTDLAVVTTLFDPHDAVRTGRQSQVWARLDRRWQVVSAHVSWATEDDAR